MGIACGSFVSIQATIIYLLIYVVMNIWFFTFYLNTFFTANSKSIEHLSDLKSLSKKN